MAKDGNLKVKAKETVNSAEKVIKEGKSHPVEELNKRLRPNYLKVNEERYTVGGERYSDKKIPSCEGCTSNNIVP